MRKQVLPLDFDLSPRGGNFLEKRVCETFTSQLSPLVSFSKTREELKNRKNN
jgi:hypothetical protein